MNRQQNAERISEFYGLESGGAGRRGPGLLETGLRYVAIAVAFEEGPGPAQWAWFGASSEQEAFAELGERSVDGSLLAEAVYDLDNGERITLAIDAAVTPPRITRSMDAFRRPNPCAVGVGHNDWPVSCAAWVALGFSAAEAEQLIELPRPTLDDGSDSWLQWLANGWNGYLIEWAANAWRVVPANIAGDHSTAGAATQDGESHTSRALRRLREACGYVAVPETGSDGLLADQPVGALIDYKDALEEHARTDGTALDRIADRLGGQEWTPDHLDYVAEVVCSTGRSIADLDED